MSQPKEMVCSAWRDSMMELTAMYLVTVVGCMHLLSVHWVIAMASAPLVMGAVLIGVVVLVEMLYLIVVGIDRVGSAIGLRKSPLS